MDKKSLQILAALAAVLVIFAVSVLVVGNMLGIANFQTGSELVQRFSAVGAGLLIVFLVYYTTRKNSAWDAGTRQVVYMAIGAALYAVLSYLFNGTVFVVPAVSQVALRPAIVIPMFFGYTFGPLVGFFTGAVGNLFGDAMTGFGLSPQWSIGNGLVGFVSGLAMLFGKDKRNALNIVLYLGGVLAALTIALYIINPNQANLTYYNPENDTFGETTISMVAAISIFVGFVLVVAVRLGFGSNENVAAAVTWSMLGNILGIGFASLADIFVNGYSLSTTIVGQFLPAAGPNLVFAAILIPLLVSAYGAVLRQSGR